MVASGSSTGLKVVVMGVAGSGKSTLAEAIALALGARLIEGDAHHSASSRDKMSRGIALQDSDREPWLEGLAAMLAAGPGADVLTCSALKRRYRDRLRSRVPELRFVYLEIDPDDAGRRVGSRAGHMFPATLVASQFETLEAPHGEPGVFVVAAALTTEQQLAAVLRWLKVAESAAPLRPRE